MTPVSEPEVQIIGPDGVPIGVVRRPPPRPGRLWLHTLLFALTSVTTTVLGALQFGTHASALREFLPWGFILTPNVVLRVLSDPIMRAEGLSFSVPLLLILVCHEAGHYFACRSRRLDASLPYFLPLPLGIGTLGAFIRIRSRLGSRTELMDIGAWGPIAGFLATLPTLVVGIALSTPEYIRSADGPVELFAEPAAFRLINLLLHPEVAAGADLRAHAVAMAGWFGLLVTMINLLPFGQLDGGHVLYALLGARHRRLVLPLLAVVFALGFLYPGWWVWMALALALGLFHPRVPDETVPLDRVRTALGWACIVIFALTFMPAPITIEF